MEEAYTTEIVPTTRRFQHTEYDAVQQYHPKYQSIQRQPDQQFISGGPQYQDYQHYVSAPEQKLQYDPADQEFETTNHKYQVIHRQPADIDEESQYGAESQWSTKSLPAHSSNTISDSNKTETPELTTTEPEEPTTAPSTTVKVTTQHFLHWADIYRILQQVFRTRIDYKLHNKELHSLHRSPNIVTMSKQKPSKDEYQGKVKSSQPSLQPM